jgi:hypothetical protein
MVVLVSVMAAVSPEVGTMAAQESLTEVEVVPAGMFGKRS